MSLSSRKLQKDYYYNYVHWTIAMSIKWYRMSKDDFYKAYFMDAIKKSLTLREKYIQILKEPCNGEQLNLF